jgi:hypothetical protein
MSQHPPTDSAASIDQTNQELRVEDLERRIVALEAVDSASLGSFTIWDWVACLLGGLVIPIAALWWFAK